MTTTPAADGGMVRTARSHRTRSSGSAGRTLACARRVLQQLSHDHRSVALIVLMPSILLLVFRYVYDDAPIVFDRIGPQMLGLFPFIIMFLVTSVTMVRERTSGTLERLLTTPLKRGELIGGYALGFGVAALVQAVVSSLVAIYVLGLDVEIPWAIGLFAVIDAVLGTALGLLMSAFATTEFQAVQFMPLVVLPQILLCGLFVPRDMMPRVLELISDVLPLSYATDAFSELAVADGFNATMTRDLVILVGFVVVSVALASLTLRRQSP
jgi:ABC-2 type transport system permease protein